MGAGRFKLKRTDPAEAPFAPGFLPRLAETNPEYEVQYVVVAGGFPGEQLYPEGLVVNPVTASGFVSASKLMKPMEP